MVDPVSIGAAVAVLIAAKFGEGVAQNAGNSTWVALGRLRQRVAAKLRSDTDATEAISRLSDNPNEADRSIVAARVTDATVEDPAFRADIEELLALIRQDRVTGTVIAQAYDNAKQLNIHGDNHGAINL